MIRCTLFWLMNRWTLAIPLSGLHSSSSRITSTLAPLMPPLALTASSSLFAMSPYAIPDSTIMRSEMPMRIVLSCASAGAATHAPAIASAAAARSVLLEYLIIRVTSWLRETNGLRVPPFLPWRRTIELPAHGVHAMMPIPIIAFFNHATRTRNRSARCADAGAVRRDLPDAEHDARRRAARPEPADGEHLAGEAAARMARPSVRAHVGGHAADAARRCADRSGARGACAAAAAFRRRAGVRPCRRESQLPHLHDRREPHHAAAADPRARPLGRTRHPDRKSTRLNSSHITISYAVFCLKKKKIISAILTHYKKQNNIT